MTAQLGPSVLFVNQRYWFDVTATGQHHTDVAEHLAGAGFDVASSPAGSTAWGGVNQRCSRRRSATGSASAEWTSPASAAGRTAESAALPTTPPFTSGSGAPGGPAV